MTLKRRELADLPADAALSQRQVLARAYCDYHRYSVTLKHGDVPLVHERDVLIAGKVAVVMPIDLARQEIVLIRQFRLAAHLANGRGDLVEFVAGRVEPGESLFEAARRECKEEIGVRRRTMSMFVSSVFLLMRPSALSTETRFVAFQ
jgi:ADP-ribose pyrophosphatase